ncbi:MAG: TetR/AcrR family transcriptional regulator [Acidimicrobiia bacterium]
MSASSSPDASVPRRRLGRAERRDSLLAAASRAFAVGGFAATSMADISAAAGVSHLIVYRHFASKHDLYVGVLQHTTDELTRVLGEPRSVGSYGPTPEAILAVARGDEAGFRVLWRHATREPEFTPWVDMADAAINVATRRALAPVVASEQRDWAVRATSAYVVDAVLHWIEFGDPGLDDRFAGATDAALRAGVRSWARSSGAPSAPTRRLSERPMPGRTT